MKGKRSQGEGRKREGGEGRERGAGLKGNFVAEEASKGSNEIARYELAIE